MTPLPTPLARGAAGPLTAWRIDREEFAPTWDSGEGARRFGGRWSSKGRRVIYCALDPSTAILEVGVHRAFEVLDTEPHALTSLAIGEPDIIRIVWPNDLPNPNWLTSGGPGAGQQAFGDKLLAEHGIFVAPSCVSTHSWNLMIEADIAAGRWMMLRQEPFALDPRLNPAKS